MIDPPASNARPASVRCDGMVLVSSVLLLVVLFGLTGSVLLFSLSESHAMQEVLDTRQAFYLAEAGIESAKWEIADGEDPDANGIGVREYAGEEGAYKVAAEYLGDGRYRLVSTGEKSGRRAVLEAVVARSFTTTFPYGAITVAGPVGRGRVRIKKHSGLVLDGGNAPAIRVSDPGLYEELYEEFSEAIRREILDPANLSGTGGGDGTEDVAADAAPLPLRYDPEVPEDLARMRKLYREMVERIRELRDKARVYNSERNGLSTLGSAEDPVLVRVPDDFRLEGGRKLRGYGTLIVTDRLTVDNDSALEWNGNVIVVATGDRKARLDVHKGTLRVKGNLVVLGDSPGGEASPSVEFRVREKGTAVVDGSVFVGTDSDRRKKSRAKLELKEGGKLIVNGLLTLSGRKVEAKSKHDAQLALRGMLQIAVPPRETASETPDEGTELRLEFDGRFEAHKDDERIALGAEALRALEATLSLPSGKTLYTEDVVTLSWRRLGSESGGAGQPVTDLQPLPITDGLKNR